MLKSTYEKKLLIEGRRQRVRLQAAKRMLEELSHPLSMEWELFGFSWLQPLKDVLSGRSPPPFISE